MSDGSFDGAAAAATLIHRQQLRRVHGRKTKAKRNRERKQKKTSRKRGPERSRRVGHRVLTHSYGPALIGPSALESSPDVVARKISLNGRLLVGPINVDRRRQTVVCMTAFFLSLSIAAHILIAALDRH